MAIIMIFSCIDILHVVSHPAITTTEGGNSTSIVTPYNLPSSLATSDKPAQLIYFLTPIIPCTPYTLYQMICGFSSADPDNHSIPVGGNRPSTDGTAGLSSDSK